MTEFATIVTEDERGLLTFKIEIRQSETTTEKEMTGVKFLSDEVNQVLTNVQRRASLRSDWQEQYKQTGIDVPEGIILGEKP